MDRLKELCDEFELEFKGVEFGVNIQHRPCITLSVTYYDSVLMNRKEYRIVVSFTVGMVDDRYDHVVHSNVYVKDEIVEDCHEWNKAYLPGHFDIDTCLGDMLSQKLREDFQYRTDKEKE